VELCNLGGRKTYLGLLKAVGLSNPFKAGSMRKIIRPLKGYLDTLDPTNIK
jgi:hypothetical protein